MTTFIRIAVATITLTTQPALASDCTATAARTAGTHYLPVTTQKINIGRGLVVSGHILSAGNCQPIAHAKISHWQAGENGQYQDRLRAYLFSGKKGSYRFRTEWPAAIIPHIHFIVSADGFETIGTHWIGKHKTKAIRFNVVLRPKRSK